MNLLHIEHCVSEIVNRRPPHDTYAIQRNGKNQNSRECWTISKTKVYIHRINADEMLKNMSIPEQGFVGQVKLLTADQIAEWCLVKIEEPVSIFALFNSYINISILGSCFAVTTTITNKLFKGIRLYRQFIRQ